MLKVSNVAVLKWIKGFGEQIIQYKNEVPAKIVELDELHTYIKKTIVGSGLLLIELGKNTSIVCLEAGVKGLAENYGS
jgi:hypothetical protein